MSRYMWFMSVVLCAVLLCVAGLYANSLGVRFQLPWRAKANAARAAAQAKQKLEGIARNPSLIVAEGDNGDEDVLKLHRIARVSRFLLPYLLNDDPARDEHGILQRLATVDVEPVTFQNDEIARLESAISDVRTSVPNQNLDSDISSLIQALEKARRSGQAVTFY